MKQKKLLLIVIPRLLVLVSNLVFFILLFFRDGLASQSQLIHPFLISVIATVFLIIFLQGLKVQKESDRNISNGFIFFFYLLTILIFYLFFQPRIDFALMAYLLFTQSLLARLAHRLIYGGIPLFSLILNFAIMYLVLTGKPITFIPLIYLIIQLLENTFNVKYSNLEIFIAKNFSSTILLTSLWLFISFFTTEKLSPTVFQGLLVVAAISATIDFLNLKVRQKYKQKK